MDEPYYHELFTMLSVVSTTATQTSHPQARLGYASEPPTLSLYLVKAQATRTGHPSPDQKQRPGQGPSQGPYYYRDSDSPPLNITTARLPLYSCPPPPAAIKGVQIPQGTRGQHFTVCAPLSILALASITLGDLGFTLSFSLYPYYEHLVAG
jgi:hypothetical protein